jgi:hypothetical protein
LNYHKHFSYIDECQSQAEVDASFDALVFAIVHAHGGMNLVFSAIQYRKLSPRREGTKKEVRSRFGNLREFLSNEVTFPIFLKRPGGCGILRDAISDACRLQLFRHCVD